MGRFLMKLCCRSEFHSSSSSPSSYSFYSSPSSPPLRSFSRSFSSSPWRGGGGEGRGNGGKEMVGCMANEVLKESFELYDGFCEEVISFSFLFFFSFSFFLTLKIFNRS